LEKKLFKNFSVFFFIFLLAFNIISISHIYGFETKSKMGDLPGLLDDASRSPIIQKKYHIGNPIHQDEITYQALKFLKPEAIRYINDGHEILDFIEEKQYDSLNHFDNCEFSGTSNKINQRYDEIISILSKQDPDKLKYDKNTPILSTSSRFGFSMNNLPDGAFTKFGEILHVIQDFYSHTNWVELEKAKFIPQDKLVDETNKKWKILKSGEIIEGTKVKVIEGNMNLELTRPNNGKIVTIKGEPNAGLISGVANDKNRINNFGKCPPMTVANHQDPNILAIGHWDPFYVKKKISFFKTSDEPPTRVNIGTVKFGKIPIDLIGDDYKKHLDSNLKYTDPIQLPNIAKGLNKDTSDTTLSEKAIDDTSLHARAKKLAIDQTQKEWCRLVNLANENDKQNGIKFLFDHWVQDKKSAQKVCNGEPIGKVLKSFYEVDIGKVSTVTIDASESFDPENKQLTYSLKQIGGEPLQNLLAISQLNQDEITNPQISIDLSPLKTKGITGTFTFNLKVNNGLFDSEPVSVNILVYNSQNSKTFTVNSDENLEFIEDDCEPGAERCTFHTALGLANENPGKDTIKFTHAIKLQNCAGYFITDPVDINGTINGKPGVEINCDPSLFDFNVTKPLPGAGLYLRGGGSIIEGLAINGFQAGIYVYKNGGNIVQGNYFGYGINGEVPSDSGEYKNGDFTYTGNYFGLLIRSSGNLIGGSNFGEGNIITNNGYSGIVVANFDDTQKDVSGNIIQGNYIGTGINGEPELVDFRPDEDIIPVVERYFPSNYVSGIDIINSEGNIIGGTITTDNNNNANNTIKMCQGPCNIISGSGRVSDLSVIGSGIRLYGNSSNNMIQGNYIGTDKNGKEYGNILNGISIFSDPGYPGQTPNGNIIGGIEKESGNLISSNYNSGIFLKQTSENKVFNNFIGTDKTGSFSNSASFSISNDYGIVSLDSDSNQIGGDIESTGNIISGNGAGGIVIASSSNDSNNSNNTIISGNYIGTDKDGLNKVKNKNNGITIIDSQDNVIGGSVTTAANNDSSTSKNCTGSCNLISGYSNSGISITGSQSQNNYIGNNFIGTSIDGNKSIPNGYGILSSEGFFSIKKDVSNTDEKDTDSGSNNIIDSNVISGNTIDGIQISKSQQNIITENKIGTSYDLITDLGNRQNGISLIDSSETKITNNNIIAHNKKDGVAIVGSSELTKGNTINRNSIYSNVVAGIDLGLVDSINGLTPNDSNQIFTLDLDEGPNELMNFPVGVTAYWDQNKNQTVITGILPTPEPENKIIDVYSSDEEKIPYNNVNSSTRTSQGKIHLGSTSPNADGKFMFIYAERIPLEFVTATATNEEGSTSEFSPICGDPDDNGNTDNDNDGICDDWEIYGIDLDGNGGSDFVPFLSNQSKDHINHKDIFVEMDYMEDHKPFVSALNLVNISLAISPVTNPDGKNGTNFLTKLDEEIKHENFTSYEEFQNLKKLNFGTKNERENSNSFNILTAKSLIFRYAFFGHERSDTSPSDVLGQANIGDDDMLFTFGGAKCEENDLSCYDSLGHTIGTSSKQAINIFHELGHTLNLDHGGGDSENCKPNYLSIMNYAYMIFSELEMQKQKKYPIQDITNIVENNMPLLPLEFSTQRLDSLDENALNESSGVQIYGSDFPPGLDTLHAYPQYDSNGNVIETGYDVSSTGLPIDWNNNGILEPVVQQDINNFDSTLGSITDCSEENKLSVLKGFNDWEELQYNFRPNVFSSEGFAREHGFSDPPNSEVLKVHSILKNNFNFVNTSIKSAIDGFGNSQIIEDNNESNANNKSSITNNNVSSSYMKFEFIGNTSTLNSEISQYYCSLDGSPFLKCSNPQEYKNLNFGKHTFKVKAVDSNGNVDISPSIFNWFVTNHLPIANAGLDLIVNETKQFTLNGNSTDEDGDNELNYIWKQIAGKKNVTFNDNSKLHTTLVAPNVNYLGDELSFQLQVFDNNNGSNIDFVNIGVKNVNHKPIAVIGNLSSSIIRTVDEGTKDLVLDGSMSFDLDSLPPDSDKLTYKWSQIFGTPIILNSSSSSAIKFNAPIMEFPDPYNDVLLKLTVSDESGASDSTYALTRIQNTFANNNAGEVYIYKSQFGEGKFIVNPDKIFFDSISPRGFDYDETNQVFYFADDVNDSIKKLDANGTLLWSSFSFDPFDVAVSPDGTKVYAVNNLDTRVEIFTPDGFNLGSWPTYADSSRSSTVQGWSIDTDPTGEFIYVYASSKIFKYNKFGNFISSWAGGGGSSDEKISINDNGDILVSASTKMRILDGVNGNLKKEILHPFARFGGSFESVGWDSDKNIYAMDGFGSNSRNYKFNPDGALLTPLDNSIILKKDPLTCGGTPRDLAVESSGEFIYRLEGAALDGSTVDCVKKFKKNFLPLAFNQNVNVPKEKSVNITLIAQDRDSTDKITYKIINNSSQGTITDFNPQNGTLVYTPNNNFTGADTFRYNVEDGIAKSPNNGLVTLYVGKTPPVALNQNVNTQKNTPLSITLEGIDPDLFSSTLLYNIQNHPNHGTISVPNPNPSIVGGPNYIYTPDINFTGADTFTFKVSNKALSSVNNATVTIFVKDMDKRPIANAGADFYVFDNTTTNIVLSGKDSFDPDGGNITSYLWQQIEGPPVGLNSTNTVATEFDSPFINMSSSLKFNLTVTDDENSTSFDIVNVNLIKRNVPPIANAGPDITIGEDQREITLSGFRSFDPDGGNITSYLWQQIAGPAVQFTNILGGKEISFETPSIKNESTLRFNLTVFDDYNAKSNSDLVEIHIMDTNTSPLTNNQTISTEKNISVPITLEAIDQDRDSLKFILEKDSLIGKVTELPSSTFFKSSLAANNNSIFQGNISYVFDPITRMLNYSLVYNGIVSFDNVSLYIYSDSLNNDVRLLSILPLGNNGQGQIGPLDDFQRDQLFDQDLYTVIQINSSGNDANLIVIEDQIDFAGMAIQKLIYEPKINYTGFDEFKFKVFDGKQFSNTSSVKLEVHPLPVIPVNHAPTVSDQLVNVAENSQRIIEIPSFDSDNDVVSLNITNNPLFGQLSERQDLVYFKTNSTSSNELFSNSTAQGLGLFEYNETSDMLSYFFNFTGINDLGNSTLHFHKDIFDPKDIFNTLNGPVEFRLNGNETVNGKIGPLTQNQQNDLYSGKWYVNLHTPDFPLGEIRDKILPIGITLTKVKYTPNQDFEGPDSFTFVAKDAKGAASNQGTIRINVGEIASNPPVARDSLVTLEEDTSIPIQLDASDSDVNDDLTYSIESQPISGKVISFDFSTGSLVYEPDPNFNGNDGFLFKAVDQDGLESNIATVDITVNPVNDPPIANNQQLETDQNNPLKITLSGADPIDNDTISQFRIVNSPTNGQISNFNQMTGELIYYPNNNFFGSESFTFKVIDSQGLESTESAVVSINVKEVTPPINTPPIAVDKAVETNSNTPVSITLEGTDSDQGDTISGFIIISSPTNGQISNFNSNTGTLTYTPNNNYAGQDTFTFKVTDSRGLQSSNIGVISITVKSPPPPDNEQPPLPLPSSVCIDSDNSKKKPKGTQGNDDLIGTSQRDVITGLGGNDRFNGCSGDDTLNGNSGNDGIAGGPGDDNLHGNEGNDYLQGDTGSDSLYGNEGNDILVGNEDRDRFFCGSGNDKILDFEYPLDVKSNDCEEF
jgi:parallel beta-helix repeat protein